MKSVLLDTFHIFLVVGSVASLVLGLILFSRPDVMKRINDSLNTWHSGRKKMKPFEIMRDTDSYFYRNNKLWGWVMLLASLFCLYKLIQDFRMPFVFLVFPPDSMAGIFMDIALQTMRWLFLIFVALGIPVWVLLIIDPVRLKKISLFFNQWISTRLMLLPLEKMYFGVDSFVLRHHKPFGILVTVASALILFSLLRIGS